MALVTGRRGDTPGDVGGAFLLSARRGAANFAGGRACAKLSIISVNLNISSLH